MAKDKVKEAEAAPEGEGAVEGEGAASGKKKPPLKLLIIGGVAAVLVLGGGGAGAFIFLKPKPEAAAGEHGAKPEKKPKKKPKAEHGGGAAEAGAPTVKEGPEGVVFYTLPDIVVNMQTADGRPTFLKLKLTFELPDEEAVEVLNPNMPRLQDMFQTFLRELRPEDLQGSQGSYQLRMEILRRVNLVVAPTKVNAVLIEEMLIN
ncbi:MAG TPA: flagellar basal body-associated FliL family protein [Caulobacter sp.]|nr:flagellar basal body-associated FliL family protein [Caulobacter sp.]